MAISPDSAPHDKEDVAGLCRTELNFVGCISPLDARYASP